MIFYANKRIMQNAQNNKVNQSQNVSRETTSQQVIDAVLHDWHAYSHKHDAYYIFAYEVVLNNRITYLDCNRRNGFLINDLGLNYEKVIIECDKLMVDVFGNRVPSHKTYRHMVQINYGGMPNIDDLIEVYYMKHIRLHYDEMPDGEIVSNIRLYN